MTQPALLTNELKAVRADLRQITTTLTNVALMSGAGSLIMITRLTTALYLTATGQLMAAAALVLTVAAATALSGLVWPCPARTGYRRYAALPAQKIEALVSTGHSEGYSEDPAAAGIRASDIVADDLYRLSRLADDRHRCLLLAVSLTVCGLLLVVVAIGRVMAA